MLLLTAAALLVHGYHPYAEDAEIYLPGIERILNPALFPTGREFFASHASLTFFPNVIAFSLRAFHLPMEAGIFLWHMLSIFLLLLACWKLSGVLFADVRARWAGVGLVAALFTIPVAGTALYIMDQYLNPRNLAVFCAVFAVAGCLEKKYVRAVVWLGLSGSVHPLMTGFAGSFCALLWMTDRIRGEKPGVVKLFFVLPFGISLLPPTSAAYHVAALQHDFHYIGVWHWYEWLGVSGPMALRWWFYRVGVRQRREGLSRLCGGLLFYGLIFFVAAMVIDLLPARFESLTRFQLLRSFHLIYIVLFLVMGGFAGEYVLKKSAWRWMVLFIPLGAGMFAAQRELFPASAHVEWPGIAPRNPWAQTFVWVREHTPVEAVFALDPRFMQVAGEDAIGFRCLAQRSRMADDTKDSGAVSMFPPLAEDWWDQVQAQTPWESLQLAAFERLKARYGVGWIVVRRSVAGVECVYENQGLRVCRVP
ncbi:MAG TPA: hypothetical protein VI386_12160 [Candidatus Sulfotelmatobacter sp.]